MRTPSHKSGFTLVELLLAMTLTSLLTLGLHRAFQHSYAIWKRVETSRPICLGSNTLFDRLRTELASAYVLKPIDPETTTQAPPGSGPESLFAFRAVSQGGTDCIFVLEFFSVTPSWNQHLNLARPCRIRYEAWRDTQTHLCRLIRIEQLYAGNQAIGQETIQSVLTGFTDIKTSVATLSDMGSPAWNRQFESKKSLPNAIDIELQWPLDTSDDTVSMEMMYVLQQASTPVPQSGDTSDQEALNAL